MRNSLFAGRTPERFYDTLECSTADGRQMPGLNSRPATAMDTRNVATPIRARAISSSSQCRPFHPPAAAGPVKLFFARVALDMTPVQFAALAAVAQRPHIDQARVERPHRLRPGHHRRRDWPAGIKGLARAVGVGARPARQARAHHAIGQEGAPRTLPAVESCRRCC